MYCVSCEVRTEFICYVEESRQPLWSSGQSSRLQIQRSGFDSFRHHIFWEVVGLERGPLSLVITIEELLERKSSFSYLENREYCRRDLSRWPLSANIVTDFADNKVRSAGIVLSPTQGMEFRSFDWIFNACCRSGVKMEHKKADFTAKECRAVMKYLFVKGNPAKRISVP
jgi:hypothetical protein